MLEHGDLIGKVERISDLRGGDGKVEEVQGEPC